jgi:hypothetical protein
MAGDSGAFFGTSHAHRPYIYHTSTPFRSPYAAHGSALDFELLDAEFDRVELACAEEELQTSTSTYGRTGSVVSPACDDDAVAAQAEDIHEAELQDIPTFGEYTFRTSLAPCPFHLLTTPTPTRPR